MQYSRVISFFLVLLTFGLATFANPLLAGAAQRDNAEVEKVLTTLKTSTDDILPRISALGTSGKATESNAAPLINELTTALNTASTSLTALQTTSNLVRRQLDNPIADLIGAVISGIADGLGTLLGGLLGIPTTPEPAPVVSARGIEDPFDIVDEALSNLLGTLAPIIGGVLGDVLETESTEAEGLLGALGFNLTLSALDL